MFLLPGVSYQSKNLYYTVNAMWLKGKYILKNLMRALVPVAVALVLVLPADQAGAQTDTATVIRNIQDIYAGVDSFRARFRQELTHQAGATTETRHGSFLFRKPMLVRWETEEPHPELMVVTDREIWNYLPDEKLAYRYSLSLVRDSRSIIVVITGQSALDKEFEVERMADEEGLIHLLLYPRDPAPELTEAHVWVDPGSFLIKQAMGMDFYGNTNKIIFETMTPGGQVGAADFAFTPPPGTEVEDHIADEGPAQTRLLN